MAEHDHIIDAPAIKPSTENTGHTPGPWSWSNLDLHASIRTWPAVIESDGRHVGSFFAHKPEDARLAIASPDLLAACEAGLKALSDLTAVLYGGGLEVAGWHLNGDTEPMDTFFDENTTGNEVALMRAAIAKATGQGGGLPS